MTGRNEALLKRNTAIRRKFYKLRLFFRKIETSFGTSKKDLKKNLEFFNFYAALNLILTFN